MARNGTSSKVGIEIELNCETIELRNKLAALFDCIESVKNGTNQLYDDTNDQLKSLLKVAIDKIDKKDGAFAGTIQKTETTLCSGWEGTITLYTVSQHFYPKPIPDPIPEKDSSKLKG